MASNPLAASSPSASHGIPRISLSDPLLSSSISLPPNPAILYSVLAPIPNLSSRPYSNIEFARRRILSRNASAALLDSLLTSVQIGQESCIYVFLIITSDRINEGMSTLKDLHFDGLIASEHSSFTPQGLYPCSSACSLLPIPCPTCLNPPSSLPSSFPPQASYLLPRKPLRRIYSHFLEAIRVRLLDDIAEASIRTARGIRRQVKRLKGGFLLGPPPSSSEWGAGWEYRTLSRPLIYCHLQIHLSPSATRLTIHPILLPTPFLPLLVSLPLPPGSPITLLPHGTPAYFLTTYAGPTHALTKQFQDSLRGMGVGDWEGDPPSYENSFESQNHDERKFSGGQTHSTASHKPAYIIAWINVENKQGEDKGISIIYPTRLCTSFLPSSSAHRQALSYIPELSVQLQPSPQVPSAPPPTSTSLLRPTAEDSTAPFTSSISPDIEMHDPIARPDSEPAPLSRSCRILSTYPAADALRAFRSFTLSKSKDVRRVATEVGGYVDTVARERERERERLKREREGGGSPRLARTTTTTPAPAPTPTTVDASASTTDAALPPVAPQPTPADQSHSGTGPSQQPQQQPPLPSHNFYPSPPQTNPPPIVPSDDMQTSPVVNVAELPSTAVSVPSDAPAALPSDASPSTAGQPPTSTPAPSFDPFGNIDPAWSQPPQPTNNDFLGMSIGMDIGMDFGMDIGIGFSLNMDSIASGGGGSGAYDNRRVGMDYEDAFTDDDYSFFDQPSRTNVPSAPPAASLSAPEHSGSGLTPAAGPAPLGVGMSSPLFSDIHLASSGLPLARHQHSSSWAQSGLAEAFTPRFSDHVDAIHPDLLPPSPWHTPESHLAPVTPNVQLTDEHGTAGRASSTSARQGPNVFDPIPFAPSHRVADGKYAVGKFALPSPPDEEDRTEPLRLSSSPSSPTGWRFKYSVATDPRIGVVRKLIGVKRKATSELGGRENVKMSPSWLREHEDWERSTVDQVGEDEDGKSEGESEDGGMEEVETPLVSRSSTPLPAYLPLGPGLLHTQFHHSHLLPLCTPLRPPGAAVAPTNIIAAAALTSVPTPVSPAATMGAASEKSKSLEAAAYTVAKEVVENSIWAEAWRANTLRSKPSFDVWPADVKVVTQLLETVPTLEGPLDMATFFGLEPSSATSEASSYSPLQTLESPMILIGKGDAVIQIIPTALRFWEKLGLGPRGGKKDVTAFVLFEDDGEERQQQVETWLADVSATYTGKHLGVLVPGSCSSCPKDGIVPLRFDSSFRKSLASFVASLPTSQSSLVFYIVTPSPTMTLASPLLRQVFSAVRKALKTYSEAQILFHFVPEQHILGSTENHSALSPSIEVLCYSVYDRILQPVDRLMSRQFTEHERIRNYFQDPAFTLARPIYNKVSYVRTPHSSLDVMDRHAFLHVGYQISPCGKWILAACVDQRGEAHDLGVWLTQTPRDAGEEAKCAELYMVDKVWEFAVQFAKKANIEWRIVFAKLGAMEETELVAWTRHIASAILTCHELPPIHVTLLSVEPDAPWTFIAPSLDLDATSQTSHHRSSTVSSPPKHHISTPLFVDISATTYALYPTTRLPLTSPPAQADLALSLSFVPEHLSTPSDTDPIAPKDSHSLPHPVPLLPYSTTTLIRVPANASYTTITMLHIHLLFTLKSPDSTINDLDGCTNTTLHADITRNYHELAILACSRWRLGVNPILPFHLAAVSAMHIALDRDRQRGEGVADS